MTELNLLNLYILCHNRPPITPIPALSFLVCFKGDTVIKHEFSSVICFYYFYRLENWKGEYSMDPLLSETEIFFLFDIEQKIMINTAHSDLTPS